MLRVDRGAAWRRLRSRVYNIASTGVTTDRRRFRVTNPELRSNATPSASARDRLRLRLAGVVALLLVGAAVGWNVMRWRGGVGAVDLVAWMGRFRASPLAVPATLGIYVAAGLTLMPMSFVMMATGLSFGPVLGAALALSGCLLSAVLNYAIGAALGRDLVHRVRSPRLQQLNRFLGAHGFAAIATVRIVPVAPFGLVNLVAGASDIRFRDYWWGTVALLTPSVILSSLFGDRIGELARNPSVATFASLVAVLGILLAVGYWLRNKVRQRADAAIVPTGEPY